MSYLRDIAGRNNQAINRVRFYLTLEKEIRVDIGQESNDQLSIGLFKKEVKVPRLVISKNSLDSCVCASDEVSTDVYIVRYMKFDIDVKDYVEVNPEYFTSNDKELAMEAFVYRCKSLNPEEPTGKEIHTLYDVAVLSLEK